jgi:putative tricarboxylic transport membrane protein
MAVDDTGAAAADDRPVVRSRSVDAAVCLLLLGLALLLGWDNWRSGISWAADGPQVGYFPFYLAVLLGAACVYGIVTTLLVGKHADEVFVTRQQARRVLQVLVPTFLFVLLTQYTGLYVASFFLVLGFMRYVGRIAWWKSAVTSFVFTALMFITFEIAFNVIMPKGPLEAVFGY